MSHKSVRLWQVCHTANLTKLFIQTIQCRPHFAKLVIIRAVRIGLFLMLKCRQIWIFSNIFWGSSLHQFSVQHINTEITNIGGKGQGTNNTNSMKLLSTIYCTVYWFIWIYLTAVQICFLCSFGKQFFSKKSSWKIDGEYRPSKFVLAISYIPWIWRQFSKIMFFFLNFQLLQDGLLRFPIFFLHYRMPVICLELQKVRHLRCLPLSSGTWSFSINLFFAESPKFYFMMANLCRSFFHYFFFRFGIIQRIFMLRNKSFIVYCTVLIAIIKVQDVKEPWLCVV